jgi:hypothetical protein
LQRRAAVDVMQQSAIDDMRRAYTAQQHSRLNGFEQDHIGAPTVEGRSHQ